MTYNTHNKLREQGKQLSGASGILGQRKLHRIFMLFLIFDLLKCSFLHFSTLLCQAMGGSMSLLDMQAPLSV